MRVQVVGGSNTVYYLHTDHLGSTTSLSTSAVGGGLVSGSTARYLPFGAWRTTPTQTLTDRGYTGHLENMELGLVYMNARYYVPAIGRFASPDTIVPEPGQPQSFNRYAYTLNNPLRYTDPTGHCAQDDDACWELAEEMYRLYGWRIDGIWNIDQIRLFLQAGQAITDWFARNGGGDATGRMRAVLGGALFAHSDLVGDILQRHHVRGNTVFLRDGFDLGTIVHELGHVIDNRLGFSWPIGSALLGGGTADDMARTLGADPTSCRSNRSICPGYETPNERIRSDDEFIAYGLNGPSEDFAQSFMLSVLQGSTLRSSYPLRAAFLADLAASLTTIQSEYSLVPQPYLTRRIVPMAAPTPPRPPAP